MPYALFEVESAEGAFVDRVRRRRRISRPRCGGELFLRFGCAEPASFVREGKVRDGAGESRVIYKDYCTLREYRDEEMVRAFHAHSVDVAPCGEEGHDGGPECEGGSGGNPTADRS